MRRPIGLLLFWLSWLLWGVLLLVPLMIEDGAAMAASAGGVLIVSETAFVLSLLLLGRPFYDAFKAGLKRHWVQITRRS